MSDIVNLPKRVCSVCGKRGFLEGTPQKPVVVTIGEVRHSIAVGGLACYNCHCRAPQRNPK